MLAVIIAWKPGLHDPMLGAWLVTLGYLTAALMCLRAWRMRSRDSQPSARLWPIVMLILLGLGINKQLDFQSLMIEIGRDLAREQGWYEQRRMILSVSLLGAAGGVTVLSMAALKRFLWSGWEPCVALIGTGLLVVMLFLQEISYGYLSTVLNWNLLPGWNGSLGVHVGEILELGFLGVIGWAAWHGRRSDRRVAMG